MTDKLRKAVQALVDRWDSPQWSGNAENLRHTGEYIAELRDALKESDQDWSLLEATQASLREHMAEIHRLRKALEFTAVHKSSDWPERCKQMVETARSALAQQDAQAVHDGDDAACSVLRQRIKASLEQAAPTPPAQRVMLTDEEIRDLWSWSMTAEAERTANTQQHAFAQGVIEAYERKNGLKP